VIVPADRLLIWTAAAVVPVATAVGALPTLRVPGLVVLVGIGLVVIIDALVSKRRLDPIRVGFPEIARMSVGGEGTIGMVVEGSPEDNLGLRLAPVLPTEIGSARPEGAIELGGEAPAVRVKWPISGNERGRHVITGCRIQCPSRLGFWSVRRLAACEGEVRVYPNLREERRALATHFLRRGGIGVHIQRQVGKGREFEKLREYVPGDGLDDIHWKASAKRSQLVTKEFQIERTQEVYAVIDASRLSARLHGEQSALERMLRAALVLGLATREHGDLFGLISFSDRVQSYLPARGGRAQFDACREAIFTHRARAVSPDFLEVATFIRHRIRRRSLLVFLTDLDDPALAEDFVRAAELLGKHHLVLVAMLEPTGAAPVFSSSAVDRETILEHLAGHLRWHRLRELTNVLKTRGVTLTMLDHESMAAEVVSRYVAIKRRQIL
jgi:uncharacterized protein (DUF58 family)